MGVIKTILGILLRACSNGNYSSSSPFPYQTNWRATIFPLPPMLPFYQSHAIKSWYTYFDEDSWKDKYHVSGDGTTLQVHVETVCKLRSLSSVYLWFLLLGSKQTFLGGGGRVNLVWENFMRGYFPWGEFSMGREVFEKELSKGKYRRGNLPEFLYKILFIWFTFSASLVLHVEIFQENYPGKFFKGVAMGDLSMGWGIFHGRYSPWGSFTRTDLKLKHWEGRISRRNFPLRKRFKSILKNGWKLEEKVFSNESRLKIIFRE